VNILVLGNAESIHIQVWMRELKARNVNAVCVSLCGKSSEGTYRVPGFFPMEFTVSIPASAGF